ncbi:MAG: glycosyltransferase family 4 protein [Symploca sp. SIO1C4]|uniref:Glycosyltransferase family 4 protein n=1 Tax=Symploca sp. SIO1C4 TaxID=2607765 RepID=A0A6B3N5T0_9CYAN|nr:glycosyltransferase family 4 protein [Symploca sp. SIO1C4]
MTKIAILFANYGPYHLARINSFQKHCNLLGWSVFGIELTRSGVAYDWKTQLKDFPVSIFSVIGEQELEKVKFTQLLQRLYNILTQINPDVLAIAGYFRLSMLAALEWNLRHRKPTILLSATKEDDAPRSWLFETSKSWLFKRYKAALVGGNSHKRYLIKLGMSAESIFFGYNVVDNEIFHPDKIKGLPKPLNRPYFLAINRFVPKKNLLLLLSAYGTYHQSAGSKAWDLVLCGDGQLRSDIEKYLSEFSSQDCIHLPGFLQQDELLPYFAHASCFIHASIQEQWGLVVNEAMAAGLPVLISNRCGCFEDLVIEGINGFGFDPENPKQLTDLMLKISSGEIDLNKMGQAALKHIQKFSPDYFAQGLIQAVKYALSHS